MSEIELGQMMMIIVVVVGVIFLATGIKIVRPTHRGVVETLGKYSRMQGSGITYIVPVIQKLYTLNITEQLIDVAKQEVITKDNLNCNVDAQVYYKVREDEESVKNAFYKVNDYHRQIVQLATTTLRNVIGDKPFQDVNSKRGELNAGIFQTMEKETVSWGIGIVRVELREITPPADVQATMNQVIKAENDKQSAIDFANAVATKADGDRRASIKEAEGIKQSKILEAQGEAQAIKAVADARAYEIEKVNESARAHFKDEAQTLKRLEVTEASLADNSKIILTKDGINPTLVINESPDKDVIPVKEDNDTKSKPTSKPKPTPNPIDIGELRRLNDIKGELSNV